MDSHTTKHDRHLLASLGHPGATERGLYDEADHSVELDGQEGVDTNYGGLLDRLEHGPDDCHAMNQERHHLRESNRERQGRLDEERQRQLDAEELEKFRKGGAKFGHPETVLD